MNTLLLPGMDGTGTLFGRFASCLDPRWVPHVVSYSRDEPSSYDELLDRVPLPSGRFVLIAESFSGPLAIRLAARHPERVGALVLVATFVTNPSRLAAWGRPWLRDAAFRMRLPDVALRFGLLGFDASEEELVAVREAIETIAPHVLAKRLREIVAVDVREAFRGLLVPTLYVAGRRDRLVGRRARAEIGALRPEVSVVELDAPHLVLQRKPRESASAISRFLSAAT
ncbi:MAG: alpha/beta fold hydrolase [Sandaracinus sp.]|nr:alpha/beta fold hydrolase [Sandaracinus sp.]MCB9618731.1 alpha/beta fold hydrolase [Sandaracinus sp.]MCB9636336.1 alpha/beta fold hydrolase [Sandaracinus sp.]